jgi:hypothetical protein
VPVLRECQGAASLKPHTLHAPGWRGSPSTHAALRCAAAQGGAATAAADGGNDRFDYNKDPISWFYQNQIKSEEQFQAKRSELREAAKERLENIFEAKGKVGTCVRVWPAAALRCACWRRTCSQQLSFALHMRHHHPAAPHH